jgi:hypothetical protein
MTFRNAFSKSAGFSDASTSWAISTKRLCRSASVSLGRRFGDGFGFVIGENIDANESGR